MRVGFAGLGRMGTHMARNLAGAGFDLTLWNRTAKTSDALAADLGCATAPSPKALSDAVDVVVTMLADDPSSDSVHFGPDGLFAGSAQTYVEMGTMSPDHIQRLVQGAPDGASVIDAPVSGATQAAADAQLVIMAGCPQDRGTPLRRSLMPWAKRPSGWGSRGTAR